MLTIQWEPIYKAQWQSYLKDRSPHYHAYQQEFAYGEAARMLGAKTLRAVILRDGSPIAVLQCHPKRWLRFLQMALIMRGPLWLDDSLDDATKQEVFHLIKRTIPLPKPRLCLIMPEYHDSTAYQQQKPVISGYHTVMLDLQQEEETLLQQLNGKWRNRLRVAEKNPQLTLSPVGLKPANYRWILEKEAAQRLSVGYHAPACDLVPAYQNVAGKESLYIHKATFEGEDVAAILCLIHGRSATYHIGWSSELGKEHHAPSLLLWKAMQDLKHKGIHFFDLGGLNTDADGAGIARFKIGTGGEVITLPGTFI